LINPIFQQTINTVFEAVEDFLNEISVHYDNRSLVFCDGGTRDGAQALVFRLWKLLPDGRWPPPSLQTKNVKNATTLAHDIAVGKL
jgi:hypothetical protein